MRLPPWLTATGYWLLLVAWAALISWFSSQSSEHLPTLFGAIWDKLLHAAAFGMFTLLLLLAVNQGFRHPVRPAMMAAVLLISLLYGMADEWHQSMVATRVASLADLLADGIGSIAALPLYNRLAYFLRLRSEGDIS